MVATTVVTRRRPAVVGGSGRAAAGPSFPAERTTDAADAVAALRIPAPNRPPGPIRDRRGRGVLENADRLTRPVRGEPNSTKSVCFYPGSHGLVRLGPRVKNTGVNGASRARWREGRRGGATDAGASIIR